MFGKDYLGLRGPKLNYAVAVIAGLDFLLFGYDQYYPPHIDLPGIHLTSITEV